jgi:hypothetical protein
MLDFLAGIQNGGGVMVLLCYIIVEIHHLQKDVKRDMRVHEALYHKVDHTGIYPSYKEN